MHAYFHTTFGFCLWDLLALIVLAVMIVVLVVHIVKQRRREKDFEKDLQARQNAQGTAPRNIYSV